jgi:uncharacterized membrane protein
MKLQTHKEIIRIAGKLRELVTVKDESGNILHKVMSPLMLEFKIKDMLQVMVGASILAIPVGFTEETWSLAASLPLLNVLGFLALSLLFISSFVYYNYYRDNLKGQFDEFVKRVASTYFISFIIVALILTLIQRTPWTTDIILALKRVIIVAFPASMSAAVADMIK